MKKLFTLIVVVCLATYANAQEWAEQAKVEDTPFGLISDQNVKKKATRSFDGIISAVLWEGECVFNNSPNEVGICIDAEEFCHVAVGDALELVYSTSSVDMENCCQIKMVSASVDDALEGNASELNDRGYVVVEEGSTLYDIILTETDVANLKKNGLRVSADNLVVSQINLIKLTSSIKVAASEFIPAKKKKKKTSVSYNMSGQVVDENYKGIVIQDGVKMVVK